MSTVKFIGAWGCLIGAGVCVILLKDMGIATLLSIMSISFSQAPSSGG